MKLAIEYVGGTYPPEFPTSGFGLYRTVYSDDPSLGYLSVSEGSEAIFHNSGYFGWTALFTGTRHIANSSKISAASA